MRTTLFFTAALATALDLANAISLQTSNEMVQQEYEIEEQLSQVDSALSAFGDSELDSFAEKVFVPTDVTEVNDMIMNGHATPSKRIVINGVKLALRSLVIDEPDES